MSDQEFEELAEAIEKARSALAQLKLHKARLLSELTTLTSERLQKAKEIALCEEKLNSREVSTLKFLTV